MNKKLNKLAIILILIPFALCAQDMTPNSTRSLFADFKASRIGDAVTIIVVESSIATNEAQKSAGRSSDIGFAAEGYQGTGELLPSTDLTVGSGTDFQGGGKATTGGTAKTRISALIDSVLSNGLVRIRGSKMISINGEEQHVLISGLVRVADMNSRNEVYSYNISEAEIVFEGSGMIEGNTNPGWITKLFHWLF